MNVLLLYTIEIFPYEQSWYSFYSQVFNFLKKRRNLNINLLIDKMIIDMCGDDYENS